MSDLRAKLKDEKRKRIDAETKVSMLEEALQQSPERVSVDAFVIPTEHVKEMLGGKWPDNGFAYDRVDHFAVEYGRIIPMDGTNPLPAPDFKIVIAE